MSFLQSKVAVAISAGTIITGTMYLVKEYVNEPNYVGRTQIDGKVVIITGANTGIGRETALELARRGGKIYMACRDMKKCEETRTEIVLHSGNRYVYCRECDLASFQSIRGFVDQFKSDQDRLDILINNAGISRCPKSVTRDGIEMQLGVNHMGHFLLTNLLVDHLIKSAPSRVVIVSSVAHKRGKINKEDLNFDNGYDPAKAYNQSKLANMLFCNELSNRLLDKNVTVNAVHPGLVSTDLYRHMEFSKSWTRYVIYPLMWAFFKYPKGGAQTIIYAAVDPELEKVTGSYFINLKAVEPSEEAQDLFLARWLWSVSQKWTDIKTIL